VSGETLTLVLIFAVLALAVIAWVVYLSAGLILAFTAFVMGLPTILVILMFVIFPPTFVELTRFRGHFSMLS
jgi:hypothetical protein